MQNSQNDLQSGDLMHISPALDTKLQAIQDEIQIVQNNQMAQQEQMQSQQAENVMLQQLNSQLTLQLT